MPVNAIRIGTTGCSESGIVQVGDPFEGGGEEEEDWIMIERWTMQPMRTRVLRRKQKKTKETKCL
jgi:hypothetical protein